MTHSELIVWLRKRGFKKSADRIRSVTVADRDWWTHTVSKLAVGYHPTRPNTYAVTKWGSTSGPDEVGNDTVFPFHYCVSAEDVLERLVTIALTGPGEWNPEKPTEANQ